MKEGRKERRRKGRREGRKKGRREVGKKGREKEILSPWLVLWDVLIYHLLLRYN